MQITEGHTFSEKLSKQKKKKDKWIFLVSSFNILGEGTGTWNSEEQIRNYLAYCYYLCMMIQKSDLEK